MGDVAEDLFPDDAEEGGFLPLSCDLFPLDEARMKELAAKWGPGEGLLINVLRYQDGKRISLGGRHPVEITSTGWLAAQYGPGTYDVQLTGPSGQYILQKRHSVGQPGAHQAPAQMFPGGPYPAHPHAPPPQYGMPPGFAPPPGYAPPGYPPPYYPQYPQQPVKREKKESLVDIMEGFMKMMVMKQTQEMARQELESKPQVREGDRNHEMMMMLMKAAMKPQKPVPQQSSNMAEFVGMLKFAQTLQKGKLSEDDTGFLKDVLPSMVDSMGPPIVSLIASMLPPEQAAPVLEIIQEHMKARQAEADAGKVVDAEGETV